MASKQRHVSSTSTGPFTCVQSQISQNPFPTSRLSLVVVNAYLVRRPPTLIPRDLLDRALQLRQIQILAAELDARVGEDGGHFGELVRVACDEVEMFGSHDRVFLFRVWYYRRRIGVDRGRGWWEGGREVRHQNAGRRNFEVGAWKNGKERVVTATASMACETHLFK